jgi:hypothetical protein
VLLLLLLLLLLVVVVKRSTYERSSAFSPGIGRAPAPRQQNKSSEEKHVAIPFNSATRAGGETPRAAFC